MDYNAYQDAADAYAHQPSTNPIPERLLARARSREETSVANPVDAAPARMSFGAMLDQIERAIDADRALEGVFLARFGARFSSAPAKVSLAPFPIDPGTVLASIWDNQPNGKAAKIDGDKSRDRPARYALSITASTRGHRTPLTTKNPDFVANVGDLFAPQEVRDRLRRAWKSIDEAEADFIKTVLLPRAEAGGMLIARLCYKRAAKAGGGTHWHPYHYAMIKADELEARAVSGIGLIIGADPRVIFLPRCSTLDSKGQPFKQTTKATKSGGVKVSGVVLQSRATDLTSDAMKAWATGKIELGG